MHCMTLYRPGRNSLRERRTAVDEAPDVDLGAHLDAGKVALLASDADDRGVAGRDRHGAALLRDHDRAAADRLDGPVVELEVHEVAVPVGHRDVGVDEVAAEAEHALELRAVPAAEPVVRLDVGTGPLERGVPAALRRLGRVPGQDRPQAPADLEQRRGHPPARGHLLQRPAGSYPERRDRSAQGLLSDLSASRHDHGDYPLRKS